MATYTAQQQAAIAEMASMNPNTYHPDSNPFGFSGEGYKPNVPKHANDTAVVANAVAGMATIAEEAASTAISVAVNAPTANSDSTLTIAGSGSKVFHTTTDLQSTSPFRPTMWIKATSVTDATKWMWGFIPIGGLDYAADTMTMTVLKSNGSGSVSSWYIIATGPDGAATGLASLVEDTSPQLGGNLDTNGNDILVGSGDSIIYGGSAGGSFIDANGGLIIEPVLQAALEKITNLGSVSNSNTLSATLTLHYRLKLSGNATINPPSTLSANLLRPMMIWVTQDGTGGRTLTWGSNVFWVGGAPTMTPTAGATDIYILQGIYNGTSVVYAASIFQQGYTGAWPVTAACCGGRRPVRLLSTVIMDGIITVLPGGATSAVVNMSKVVDAGGTHALVKGWAGGGAGGDDPGGTDATGGGEDSHAHCCAWHRARRLRCGSGFPGWSDGSGRASGGQAGNGSCGSGGSYSGVFRGNTPLLIAGAGGGGGYLNGIVSGGNVSGGPGGSLNGGAGGTNVGGLPAVSGTGGSQSAGGVNSASSARNGAYLRGGNGFDGSVTNNPGAGGGGGYYGGAGGFNGGAGGGGSSFIAAGSLYSLNDGGTDRTPGGNTDADYIAGVAVGGEQSGNGGPGRLIVRIYSGDPIAAGLITL